MDSQILLEGSRRYQSLTEFDKAYMKYILNRREVWENLDQLTDEEIEKTVKGFLKSWRVRNVGRIRPNQLREKLQTLRDYFSIFKNRRQRLLSIDFDEKVTLDGHPVKISQIIVEIFGENPHRAGQEGYGLLSVRGVGPTAASKIMHGFRPQVFVMWDTKIREGYGYAGNGTGYLRFLKESQRILRRIKHLEVLEGKNLAKMLDEYNYMKFTKDKGLPDPRIF